MTLGEQEVTADVDTARGLGWDAEPAAGTELLLCPDRMMTGEEPLRADGPRERPPC